MPSPGDLKYTREHEWVRIDGDTGTIGITDYAQDQLGDIVYVDLPAAGTTVAYMEKFGEIESVKAVSELFSPVTGDVIEINADLADNPQLVNDSAFVEGWMLRVRMTNTAGLEQLLSAGQYDDFLASGAE